jgi:ADP-heptose:LPS heptosyltransferase
MFKLVKSKINKHNISLKEHYHRRNRVLIKRREGGFGDLMMMRMIFEDFHITMPSVDLTIASVSPYCKVLKDHPFAKLITMDDVNEREYGAIYDISTCCRSHECRLGPKNTKHRTDIWANHCGVELTRHEAHLTVPNVEDYRYALDYINTEKKPSICFVPTSTNSDFGQGKSLTDQQTKDVLEKLRSMGFFVFSILGEHHPVFTEQSVPQYIGISIENWTGLISAADYVLTVDTASFHFAGCLKRPLISIFSFTDGKLYGKYYDHILVQKHRDNGDWDCGPCYRVDLCEKEKEEPRKPCLTDLTVEQIIEGVKKAMLKWPNKRLSKQAVALPVLKEPPQPLLLQTSPLTASCPLASEDCRSKEPQPS